MADGVIIPIGKGITGQVLGNGKVRIEFDAPNKANFEPSSTGKKDIMKANGTMENGMTIGANLLAYKGYRNT